jgi:hypothetical protein
VVKLSPEERERLEGVVNSGKAIGATGHEGAGAPQSLQTRMSSKESGPHRRFATFRAPGQSLTVSSLRRFCSISPRLDTA